MKKCELENKKFGSLKVLKKMPSKKEKCYWLCLCDCGNECEKNTNDLTSGHVKSCGCLKGNKVEIGQKYNMLTVKSKKGEKHNDTIYWECICDCGNTTAASTAMLTRGSKKSCGCMKKNIGKDCKQYKGYEEISGTLWWTIKNHAKERNIPFEITIEEAWEKFLQQKRKCALSGDDLCFYLFHNDKRNCLDKDKSKNIQTASLDRIDSSKGYTIDNIQWVHKDINIIKRHLSEDALLSLCQKIINNKMEENKSNYVYVNKERPVDFKGYKDITGKFWSDIKRSASKRNINFDLDIKTAWGIYEKQNGRCALTGEEIYFSPKKGESGTTSLDRIDSAKEYTKDNVQWVHKNVNCMKWGFDEDYFISVCKKIAEYKK